MVSVHILYYVQQSISLHIYSFIVTVVFKYTPDYELEAEVVIKPLSNKSILEALEVWR